MSEAAAAATSAREALSLRKVRPAYEQVADQLREQIIDGTLRAGDRLPSETDLLRSFGVSRSTLREALRVLAARDLVHTVRGVNGGTFVSEVHASKVSSYLETSLGLMSGNDRISVQEILEARETVEVPAARLAAQRADAAQVTALLEAGKRQTARNFERQRFEKHATFHSTVVEASGNRLLAMMNEPNFRVLGSRFRRSDMPESWWRDVDSEHVVIAEHIAARRAEEAADAMKSHLDRLRVLYLPMEEQG